MSSMEGFSFRIFYNGAKPLPSHIDSRAQLSELEVSGVFEPPDTILAETRMVIVAPDTEELRHLSSCLITTVAAADGHTPETLIELCRSDAISTFAELFPEALLREAVQVHIVRN